MTLLAILLLGFHPFHVGLTEIVYQPQSNTYQVSLKLFTDDLELALKEESGNIVDLLDGEIDTRTDSLLFRYASTHFSISSNDLALDLRYVGSEKEYDVTWIYLESAEIPEINHLLVWNELLLEVFEDQSHIVHYSDSSGLRSELIHKDKASVSFSD